MRTHDHISVESAWLYRVFTLGPSRILLTDATNHIEGLLGGELAKMAIDDISSISIRRSWFWDKLTIHLTDGSERSVGGLDKKDASRVRDAVVAESSRRAKALGPRLKRLDRQLARLFSMDHYCRYDDSCNFHNKVTSSLRECGGIVRKHLGPVAKEALARLAPLEQILEFEAARDRANSTFVSKQIPTVQASAFRIPPRPLTEEQAEAIATDEDVTLVLAGAGTGKTSVIVGKVAYLVFDQGVPPQEILVLAFNRKAAGEVRERLKVGLAGVAVHTFHSFGRRVIAESDVGPTISKLAEDQRALTRAIDQIIGELLGNPKQSRAVINFIANHHAPYRSPFDFDTPSEYEEFVRSVELRTLSGDLVKSFEELSIANYLTQYGVEFVYEPPYKAETATRRHGQYRPDFYIPNNDIYVEHFALDERGSPPQNWTGYSKGVEWKRSIHAKFGTMLIETYSWQHRRGTLLSTLRKQLKEAGVEFKQISFPTQVRRLAQERTSWLAGLTSTFLHHVKSTGLPSHELRARAKSTGDHRRNESFLNVFDQVRVRYEQMLVREKALDFHDLINRAVRHIREGDWKSPFRYVLVDEFQDISAGRMRLLQALRGQGIAYFLVGDDWQSIYRFAGSDVGLIRRCNDLLGHVREKTLRQTFRFGIGILGPSTSFVQKNPEQTQRPLRSTTGNEGHGITVVANRSTSDGVAHALSDVEIHVPDGERRSVLVLGRYPQRRSILPTRLSGVAQRLRFSTVHAAKGREADYVIVLDMKDGRWGFPSQVEDDPLLELVLPPVVGIPFPFAEERRLFYVAMTRARIGTYLVTDPIRPSEFVVELLMEPDGLRQLGEFAPVCPRCCRGRLSPFESGKSVRCSMQNCEHQAPHCPNCNKGYALVAKGVAKCTNRYCRRPPVVCPYCGNGVLMVIHGRRGAFLGCSEYRSEQSCRYTIDI